MRTLSVFDGLILRDVARENRRDEFIPDNIKPRGQILDQCFWNCSKVLPIFPSGSFLEAGPPGSGSRFQPDGATGDQNCHLDRQNKWKRHETNSRRTHDLKELPTTRRATRLWLITFGMRYGRGAVTVSLTEPRNGRWHTRLNVLPEERDSMRRIGRTLWMHWQRRMEWAIIELLAPALTKVRYLNGGRSPAGVIYGSTGDADGDF